MKRKTFFQFAAPSMALMVFLMVVPLAAALWLGMQFLTFRTIQDGPQWVGFANYIDILSDPKFWQSFRFTALYTVIVVPVRLVIGFVIALMLDQVSKGVRGVYLSVFLLPFIVVPIVGTLMFKQLFEASGPVAWFYREFLEKKFIYNEFNVKSLVILHGIWYVTPYALVTYFAGLQTLPGDLIEAASIDGASRMQKIRHIVIPHLSSLTVLIMLISIMDSYRIFDSVFVLAEGNPIYKADTVMTYTFRTAIRLERLGLGNAMAIVTVIGIMIVLIPNLYMSYKEQIEER
ncbi:MAG: carbohydrate ABC transporter permease [Candidatus Promineifilaceae bacterium]